MNYNWENSLTFTGTHESMSAVEAKYWTRKFQDLIATRIDRAAWEDWPVELVQDTGIATPFGSHTSRMLRHNESIEYASDLEAAQTDDEWPEY